MGHYISVQGQLHTKQLVHAHVQPRTHGSNHSSSFSPLCACLLPLLLLRQGQLESILCSFLAQTRRSQGPLIKDKPSSFLSVSYIPSFSLLRHLSSSPLSLDLALFLLPLPSRQPLSIISPASPTVTALSRPVISLPPSSRWRFDIHRGTVFRVNLYKEPDLLFSFASVNYVPCDPSHVGFKRVSRSDSAAPFYNNIPVQLLLPGVHRH